MTRRRPAPSSARRARALLPTDRKRILERLNLECRPGPRGELSLPALRLRALVILAANSALRLSELVALNLVQVVDDPATGSKRWRLRTLGYLRTDQAKGRRRGDQQWVSAGTFMLGDETRWALRAYLAEAARRKWLTLPPAPRTRSPVFVAVRGKRARAGHGRLSKRTIQHHWAQLQRRAGIVDLYPFHSLRHDAMSRVAELSHGNVKMIADFGRCSVGTAMRYTHLTPDAMESLRNLVRFAPITQKR